MANIQITGRLVQTLLTGHTDTHIHQTARSGQLHWSVTMVYRNCTLCQQSTKCCLL